MVRIELFLVLLCIGGALTANIVVEGSKCICGDNVGPSINVNGGYGDTKHKKDECPVDIPKHPPTVDGVWRCVSKASCLGFFFGDGQHDSYVKINSTGDLTVEIYLGSLDHPRESNPAVDGLPSSFVVTPPFTDFIRTEAAGRVLMIDFNNVPFGVPQPFQLTMVVQNVTGPMSGYAVTSLGGILERIDKLPDNIRPLDDVGLGFRDPDSREFIFDQLVSQIVRHNDATNDYHRHSFYPGDAAATTLLHKIKTEGIQHGPVQIGNVLTTIGNSSVTTFVVNRYPHIHQSSDVTISGFGGAYAALNGNYQVLVNDIKQLDRAGQDKFDDVTKYEFTFSVVADSSQLPAFDAVAHGRGFVQPDRYGPVTEDMRYNQLVSAVIEYQTTVLPELTHGELDVAYIPIDIDTGSDPIQWRTARTFDELKQFLAAGGQIQNSNQRFGGRTGSFFSGNFVGRVAALGPVSLAFLSSNPLNDPFVALGGGLFGAVPGAFNTVAENYLLADSIRYLYYRIDPNTPAFLPVHVELKDQFGADYPAFNHVGSKLEGLLSPNVPFVDPAPEGDWSPFFDLGSMVPPQFAFFLTFAAQKNYAGIIDPQFSGGKKIGYIYFGDFQSDPFASPRNIARDWQFGTPGLGIRGIEPYVRVMSAFIRYFNEEGVDDVIFDIRGNTGGRSDGWDYLFGGDRRGNNPSASFSDDNRRPPLFADDYEQWDVVDQTIVPGERANDGGFGFLNEYGRSSRPSEARQVAGDDAVFSGGRLFILTDFAALSAADLFQRFFVGDNFDGDIGDDTQMYIAGNGGSILIGSNGVQEPVAVTASSDEFVDLFGNPVPPIAWGSEGAHIVNYGNRSSIERADVGAIHGQLVPPLSNRYQDTTYGDYGFLPNANPPFPNKGPTDSDVPASWRDSWLEETLRAACAEEFSSPSVEQSMGHAPQPLSSSAAAAKMAEIKANMKTIVEGLNSGALESYVEAAKAVVNELPSVGDAMRKIAQQDD